MRNYVALKRGNHIYANELIRIYKTAMAKEEEKKKKVEQEQYNRIREDLKAGVYRNEFVYRQKEDWQIRRDKKIAMQAFSLDERRLLLKELIEQDIYSVKSKEEVIKIVDDILVLETFPGSVRERRIELMRIVETVLK